MTSLPFPAPVHVGVVTTGGEHAQLHKYTVERNLNKIERLLKRGVDVDCVNHLGQTSLFCAALWGQVKLTDLLLDYGADPNHRCEDCSTPVHAGVLSCNPLVVSSLLDAGGDLRLHDQEGRSPFDWLRSAPQEGRTRMEDFLQGCMSSMQLLFQSPDMMNICFSAPYRSTSSLLQPVSLLDRIKSRDLLFNKKTNCRCSSTAALCLGFGKLCTNHTCQGLTVPASVPLIRVTDLTHTHDQPLLSFNCGPLTTMTRHSWRGSNVTVKSLRDSQTEHLDLLLTELQYCSQLNHPQLLQLMAVSVSDDLLRTSLVFEQVDVGTLHSLLHNKRAEFPVLQEGWILSVMLQVCEGLHFLHRGALVMRALSSHSVILTKLTVAKLSCLGFMVSSSETSCVNPPHYMELPPSLHRWAAPEVIKQRACREEADIYSVCALILELYTDDEPWGTLDPLKIKQAMDSGQALSVNSVPLPYYELVSAGLQLEPQNRTCSLQTLTNTLQQDIKRLGMDEQSRVNISAYPEPDPECGVQTRTQQTTVKEQVHIAVCRALRPVTTQVSTEEESDEVPLNKQLYRRPQCEPDRVRDACSEGEPMLPHPHTLILPLLSESDSSSDDEEPDSVTDDEEPDADMETVEQLAGLMQPKINQQISTISVNLKVSRELLQEAHRSLDMVENHCQLVHRNAPPCIHDNTSSSSSSFLSMSSEDACGVTAAVGPPSEWYTFSPYGRDDWTENLVFQLLSGDFKLLSEEELSLWLSHYPADQMQCEQRWSLPGLSTGEADQCSEQLSQYVSALDDSDLNIMSDRTQQTSRSEEDADVSVEVCRPASTGNLLVDTQNTKYESFPKHCEETVTDAAVGQTQHAANTNMTCSDVALLAEMSSITCSPAQLQQKLCSPPVNTRALPYYSTPYSPDTHRRVKIMEADLPQSPACSALHSANLKSFNTAREDSIQGFNSFQPPPFSMHSPCSSQTFITACLQSDTTSHTAIAHSTEEEEYRSEEEEEGERAGGAEAEQREEDGTSLSRPLVHLEDEEQADEEEGKSSQTAKEGRDEEENMAERSEEEEHVEQGCDEEECVDEYTDEDERVVGGSDENECEGGSDEDEHVEEECVDKYTDEKERDEEYSDEEESVAGSSDEEEHVEEEWVEKGSDEDERVVGGSDEDEAGLCHPQREVSSGAEEEGSEDEADDRRKVTSGLFDQETGGATGLLPGSQKKKKEHLMESQQSLLEDTTRAHSTLDDVLQEFECEEERESPGAQRDGKILCALFEGPTGDHDEHSARQRHSQQQ